MTDRALPLADGAPACPFVAFEDERDERASVPDHRHRCYAEAKPAPRALAHQEAYCLSSAFPVCPTFQDWARREAARAGSSSAAGPTDAAGAASAAVAAAAVHDEDARDEPGAELPPASNSDMPPDDRAQRNPPRDWSAPPPWLASAEAASAAAAAGQAEPPPFLGKRVSEPGQGLAGSAADQPAGAPPASQRETSDAYAPAGAAGAAGVAAGAGAATDEEDPGDQAVARPNRRPRAYDQHLGGPNGPDWEQPRRYEAYPTIKTRVGVPQVPRLVLAVIALVIAAVALFFFVPGLLNIGGPSSGGVTPTPSPSAAASVAPTPIPPPTPTIY